MVHRTGRGADAASTKAKSAGRTLTAKDIAEVSQPATLATITAAQPESVVTVALEAPAIQGFIPRAKTEPQLKDWYARAPKRKRGEFVNYIITSYELEVDDRAGSNGSWIFGSKTIDGPAFRFYSRHMKALLSTVWMLLGMAALGAGLTSVEINGVTRSNITAVSVISGGKIMVAYPGGGASTSADKLPADFLTSWNIGSDELAGAKAAAAAMKENNLDRATQ